MLIQRDLCDFLLSGLPKFEYDETPKSSKQFGQYHY